MTVWYGIAYVAIGITIGILVLPYRRRLSKTGTMEFVIMFLMAWPYLIIYGCLHLIKQYYWAWIDYLNK